LSFVADAELREIKRGPRGMGPSSTINGCVMG
jgi:hypothetical protein